MDDEHIKDRIREVLIESLMLEGLEPSEIRNDTPLQEELGLDSVDALELVLGLGRAFDVKIDSQSLDRAKFQSVDTLAEFVKAQLAGAPRAR